MITLNDLARSLETSVTDLEAFYGARYHVFRVPKLAGGYRNIQAPTPELCALQRKLLGYLEGLLPTHEAATGRKGAYYNASQHSGAKLLLCVDIRDFFHSVTSLMLRQRLRVLFDSEAARCIAKLVTCNGYLAQGAPTSALLADFICYELDKELQPLCAGRYTRYVDDITFSAQKVCNLPHLPSVAQALSDHKLTMNAEKTRQLNPAHPMLVTGLIINPEPNGPAVRAPRNLWRRLRAGVHLLSKGGGGTELYDEMTGLVGFLGMTDAKRAAPYVAKLREVTK